MKKKWQRKEINREKYEENLGKYGSVLSLLLSNRDTGDIEKFLNPKKYSITQGNDLPDIEIAVERIISAIENEETVLIFGDYDMDGMTATTIMYSYLKERGLKDLSYYIPNRIEQGYGLTLDAVADIEKIYAKKLPSLMITVDCGITSVKEIEELKKKGIDVVITDHHEPSDEIPKAVAVLDAKREDSKARFKEYAGVGIAYKVIMGISYILGLEDETYLKYLPFVTLGTIADIVPLLDENRFIQAQGLEMIKTSRIPSLKVIYEENKENFNEETVSFKIAPIINSSGRLGKQEVAMKFFLSKDENEAKKYLEKLKELNEERKKITEKITKDAIKQIEEKKKYEKNILIVSGDKWHIGVTGIVAARLQDKYKKPAIVLCTEGDKLRGSGRSIRGVNIYEEISSLKGVDIKFGGHELAVGLEIMKKDLEKLEEKLQERLKDKKIEIIEEYDMALPINIVSYNLLNEIQKLSPYGEKNKKPVFLFRDLKLENINIYNTLLRLDLSGKDTRITAIGFNFSEKQESEKTKIQRGDIVHVLGQIEENIYMGKSSLQLHIIDYNKVENKIKG